MENKIKTTIEYFYDLELMNPFYPTSDIVYDSTSSSTDFNFSKLLQNHSENKSKLKTVYTLYVGCFDYDRSIKTIATELNLEYESDDFNKTKCIVFGYKFKETDGSYYETTFSLVECIKIINNILKNKNINSGFSEKEKPEEILTIINRIKSLCSYDKNFISSLQEVLNAIKDKFIFIKDMINFEYIITKEEVYVSEENDKLPAPAIMGSFYLNDLNYLKDNISPKIAKFLSLKNEKQIEIEKDAKEMDRLLDPLKYPLGKWPSKFHPALMQQLAINISINENIPVFSVNGPPGTGKTTLVKEIIADFIVKRAQVMASFEHADDAFQTEKNENSDNPYRSKYHKLDSKLSQFGILVASNNNKAVENISLDLPDATLVQKDKTLTNLFDKQDNEEIYFTDTANELFDFDSWGLISVPLGKQENIYKLIQEVWFEKKESCIKDKFFLEQSAFEDAKEKFQEKLKKVNEYRNYLVNARTIVKKKKTVELQLEEAQKDFQDAQNNLKEIQDKENKLLEKIQILEQKKEDLGQTLEDINKLIPFYMKLLFFLFSKHQYFLKKKELTQSLIDINIEILNLKNDSSKEQEKVKEATDVLHTKENHLNKLSNELKIINEQLDKYQKEDIIVADDNYFQDIENDKNKQEASVWTNKYYDTLREQLFYEALQVHKAFVLTSKKFKSNLSMLPDALTGKMTEKEKDTCYDTLLNSLFLLIPVISTTLASVEKFLSSLKEDKIGLLILDEAGQATPASVLGAINRAVKTIVLGDPFQIEPVVSTPKSVYKLLNYDKKADMLYSNNLLSAQVVADRGNPFGAKRKDDKSVWIGTPLLLHRRCLNPMFKISNEIAYENKMFYCTSDKKDTILSMEKSLWYDAKGENIKPGHYIKEQGDLVKNLVKKAILANNREFPKLFIISPFRDVSASIKKELKKVFKETTSYSDKEITAWINKNCGTIHTFQGQETDEVILVLGCDLTQKKSVEWASENPNILNVAVTRARYRLAIIGEVSLWSKAKYFSTAYKILTNENSNKLK